MPDGSVVPVIVRRSRELAATPSRRPGIVERRLLSAAESAHQNCVLCDAADGALVEEHPVPNSESLFVVAGEIEAFGPGWRETLREGDFVHFAPGVSHGMRVTRGPARYLVVFAPART